VAKHASGTITARYLAASIDELLSIILAIVAALFAFFSKNRQRLGDKVAKTPKLSGKNAAVTATFSKAGVYSITARLTDSSGRTAAGTTAVTVNQVLISLTVTSSSKVTVSGNTQQFAAQGLDQFGYAIYGTVRYTWAATSLPSGATAPAFSVNGSNQAAVTTATFSKAGAYGITVKVVSGRNSATGTIMVTVNQTLTSISLLGSDFSFAARPGLAV
jgi:hypothetical protein